MKQRIIRVLCDWCDDLDRLNELLEEGYAVKLSTPIYGTKHETIYIDYLIEKQVDCCNATKPPIQEV